MSVVLKRKRARRCAPRHATSIAIKAMPFIVATFVSISGCSTGSLFDSDTPVPRSYVLAPAPPAVNAAPAPVDVSVSRPDLGSGLDTDRIAVLKGRHLDYYRGVRWGSRALELIQNLVVDSLQDQHLFRSVTPEQARVAGDYVLDLQVRDFQSQYSDRADVPTVRVAMVGRLIRIVDRELVAIVTSEANVEAQDDRLSAVMAAFESASHRAILDLGAKLASVVADDANALRAARAEGEPTTVQ